MPIMAAVAAEEPDIAAKSVQLRIVATPSPPGNGQPYSACGRDLSTPPSQHIRRARRAALPSIQSCPSSRIDAGNADSGSPLSASRMTPSPPRANATGVRRPEAPVVRSAGSLPSAFLIETAALRRRLADQDPPKSAVPAMSADQADPPRCRSATLACPNAAGGMSSLLRGKSATEPDRRNGHDEQRPGGTLGSFRQTVPGSRAHFDRDHLAMFEREGGAGTRLVLWPTSLTRRLAPANIS